MLLGKDYLQSYSRTKGKTLTPNEQRLIAEFLPTVEIKTADECNFGETTHLEIGFGTGEHLLHQASNNPDINFIGCEPFINGVAKLLRGMEEEGLKNVQVFTTDVRLLLAELPDECLDKIFILFPDPWPKAKHKKRRIFKRDTLDLLYPKLKQNGVIRSGTDIIDYAGWMLREAFESEKFSWNATSKADWLQPFDHIETKYQKKALKSGRKSVFMEFQKIDLK